MEIGKPQVHLRFDNGSEKFMIHVVTWMDQTKFREDGFATLPSSASDGVFPITLKIQEDNSIPNMALLTPVMHTLVLENVDLSPEDPFLDIQVINTSDSNSLIGRTKTHHDDGDDTGMPTPNP